MSTLYPTIILGLGTFGGNVVNFLRTLVYEELNQPGLPIFRFVHISSHAEDEFTPQPSNYERHHPWELMHVIRCSQAFEDTERIRSILQRENQVSTREALQEPGWKTWLDQSLLDMTTQRFENGAGHIRMIGRCLLWNNWRRKAMVQTTLMNFIQQITSDVNMVRETNEVMRRYYHRKEGQPPPRDADYVHSPPRVYIISSLCGGTGSGIFLDLAYFFRTQTGQQFKVFGIFAIPDTTTCAAPGKERLAANTLASLIEMNFYMNDDTPYSELFPLELQPRKTFDRPFDFIQLVSPKSRSGFMLGNSPVPNQNTLDELAHIVASSMFFELFIGTEGRKAAIHKEYCARQTEWTSTNQDGPGYLKGMSSFGAATAHYPKYRIAKAAACKLVLEKILEWTGKPVERDPDTGAMEERRRDNTCKPAKEIARQWFKTAYQRGKERFCIGQTGTSTLRDEWLRDLRAVFFADEKPKRISFRNLRNQLANAPKENPLAGRLVAGGRYARMLEVRRDALRESIIDSIKEQYIQALSEIMSDNPSIPTHIPQDLETLQEVVSTLCSSVINEVQNQVPDMPTSAVDLSPLNEIFKEFEQAEGSVAAWLVGAREPVREYYRSMILDRYRELLDQAQNKIEGAFLGRILPDLKSDLEQSVRETNTRLAAKLDQSILFLKEQYNQLVSPIRYENMVLVVTDKTKGLEHDVDICQGMFRANLWMEIFAEMQQQDNRGRSVKDQLLDHRSNYRQLMYQLVDLVVRKLMGQMGGGRPFNIIDTLLNDYSLELTTMGRRSEILVELISGYQDIFASNHPRMICGGDTAELGRLKASLNRAEIHDFDSESRIELSMNHMLHLYQEEAGIAVDDLLAYKPMLMHYNHYLNQMEPESRILHTDRLPIKFDVQVHHRIAKLQYSKGRGKPSPYTIATELLSAQFFMRYPRSNNESEAVFEWTDQGIERCAIYDPDNTDTFLITIAQSEAAYIAFSNRVVELIEEMESEELVSCINEMRRMLIVEHGAQNNRVKDFEEAFNTDFANKKDFPWW